MIARVRPRRAPRRSPRHALRGVLAAFAAAAGMLLFALCMPGAAHAAITGTWTTNANVSATATAGELTVTHTGSPGAGRNYSNATFGSSSTWWTNPYGGTVSGATGLSAAYTPGSGTISIVVTFSLPVDNPVLHVNRIGQTAGPRYDSSIWDLSASSSQGGSVGMQRLSGNSVFVLDPNGFQRDDIGGFTLNLATLTCSDDIRAMGCGSIRFNGTGITSLTLSVSSGRGSLDTMDLLWSFADAQVTRPRLTLRKRVINDNGGSATAADFVLQATRGATTISGRTGDAAITNAAVSAGTWTLGETARAGYTASAYSCVVNGGAPVSGNTLTLANGDVAVCTITNDDAPPPQQPRVGGRVFIDNGAGGGIANDGIRNGGEAPQAGVRMRLTDCAATVLSSAATDASGAYSLSVPSTTASGATLCVEQSNAGPRLSTGASAGGTALPSGSATAVGGNSYTYTRSSDRIALTWNGTSHAGLDFGDVGPPTFAASGAKTGMPGNTVSHAHTFAAGSAGTVRFVIASETATPALAGWNTKIFADPGCSGSLQPGAAQLYPPAGAGTPVAAGGTACIVVQQFIPETAPLGARHRVVVQADFEHAGANPPLAASLVLEDVTTVSDVALELKKEVRNLTQGSAFGIRNQARSGEMLEYRITYTNRGETPIRELLVSDATPGYTHFVSAEAGTTPAGLSNCMKHTPANPAPAAAVPCSDVQPTGGTGTIDWEFAGALPPGATGIALFRVTVD